MHSRRYVHHLAFRTEEYDIRYKDNRVERWQHREMDEGLLPRGMKYNVRARSPAPHDRDLLA